jgi:hypothetical protein
MVRNLKQSNGAPPSPGRRERYSNGPREDRRTASEIASRSGLRNSSSSSDTTTSKLRLRK